MSFLAVLPSRRAAWVLAGLVAVNGAAVQPGWAQTWGTSAAEAESSDGAAAAVGDAVIEIVQREGLSRARKEKLIAQTVQSALVEASERYRDNPTLLREAMEIVASAGAAAPDFADTIARTAAFAGRLPRIDGAAGRLRSAVFAARENAPPAGATEWVSVNSSPERQDSPSVRSGERRATRVAVGSTSSSRNWRDLSFGEQSRLELSLGASLTYDDNIFLRSEDEVSETIRTVTPGVEVRFGQNTLTTGSVGYKIAFRDYQKDAAPSTRLGTGHAEVGYENGAVALDLSAFYRQSEEATRDLLAVPGNQLVQTDVLNLGANVRLPLGAKTSLDAGVTAHWIDYQREGLVGTRNITIPLRAFYQMTAKLAASAGIAYSNIAPDGDGARSQDLFYNLGLRAQFTEKFGSTFAFGYRTRKVDDLPTEDLLGFDGGLTLQTSAKTSLALTFSRDFGESALGESTKENSYTLSFAAQPSLRWQFGAGLSYATSDYGARVFASGTSSQMGREDSFWSGSLNATYLLTSWLSLFGEVVHQKNDSNEALFRFDHTMATIAAALKY